MTEADVARVQRRRTLPTVVTQRIQRLLQDRFLARMLAGEGTGTPWRLTVLDRLPPLRVLPAYFVGIGVRPEHVRPAGSAGRAPAAPHPEPG